MELPHQTGFLRNSTQIELRFVAATHSWPAYLTTTIYIYRYIRRSFNTVKSHHSLLLLIMAERRRSPSRGRRTVRLDSRPAGRTESNDSLTVAEMASGQRFPRLQSRDRSPRSPGPARDMSPWRTEEMPNDPVAGEPEGFVDDPPGRYRDVDDLEEIETLGEPSSNNRDIFGPMLDRYYSDSTWRPNRQMTLPPTTAYNFLNIFVRYVLYEEPLDLMTNAMTAKQRSLDRVLLEAIHLLVVRDECQRYLDLGGLDPGTANALQNFMDDAQSLYLSEYFDLLESESIRVHGLSAHTLALYPDFAPLHPSDMDDALGFEGGIRIMGNLAFEHATRVLPAVFWGWTLGNIAVSAQRVPGLEVNARTHAAYINQLASILRGEPQWTRYMYLRAIVSGSPASEMPLWEVPPSVEEVD